MNLRHTTAGDSASGAEAAGTGSGSTPAATTPTGTAASAGDLPATEAVANAEIQETDAEDRAQRDAAAGKFGGRDDGSEPDPARGSGEAGDRSVPANAQTGDCSAHAGTDERSARARGESDVRNELSGSHAAPEGGVLGGVGPDAGPD